MNLPSGLPEGDVQVLITLEEVPPLYPTTYTDYLADAASGKLPPGLLTDDEDGEAWVQRQRAERRQWRGAH